MKDNQNIDELLNSFIDGELDPRHETEVKRLAAHDAQIAERLRRLEKTKMLVNSLPSTDAPPSLLSDVKNSLERRTLLGRTAEDRERKKGARHLIFRKLVTAAAMIVLIGGLAIVIYDILAPVSRPEAPVAIDTHRRPDAETAAEEPSKPFPAAKFNGRLELATSNFMAVEAVINRAIHTNAIKNSAGNKGRQEKRTYKLACSRQALAMLMQEVQNVWPKIGSATLRIEAETAGSEISVDNVTPNQVTYLAGEQTLEKRIGLAREFAALNTSPPRKPDEKLLAAADNAKPDLSAIPKPIPKPVLTSAEKTAKTAQSRAEDDQQINLTIELVAKEQMN
ncbi:MAG: anti-sigma factor family protein [Planctomycetota bacterium]|jgi:anti-sigma factor RsiW